MSRAPTLAYVWLEGERVRVRRPTRRDAAAAFAILHENERVLAWLDWPGPTSVADLEQRFAAWCVCGVEADDYTFVLDELASGELCGGLTLRSIGHPTLALVGYWIVPDSWGRGLATEAVALAEWLAFEKLGAEAIGAIVFTGNEASRRVLEKRSFRLAALPDDIEPHACKARPRWNYQLDRAKRDAQFAPREAEVTLQSEF